MKIVIAVLVALAVLFAVVLAGDGKGKSASDDLPGWVEEIRHVLVPDRPVDLDDVSGGCIEGYRTLRVRQFCQVAIAPSRLPVRTLQLSLIRGRLSLVLIQKDQLTVRKKLSKGEDQVQKLKVFREGGQLFLDGCISADDCELRF